MMNKTRTNIGRNPKVAVVCGKGTKWYQLKGTAVYHAKGKLLDFVKSLPVNKGYEPKERC